MWILLIGEHWRRWIVDQTADGPNIIDQRLSAESLGMEPGLPDLGCENAHFFFFSFSSCEWVSLEMVYGRGDEAWGFGLDWSLGLGFSWV